MQPCYKNLTQDEVDEIIDYYMTTEILPDTNRAALYVTVQQLFLGYFLKESRGTDNFIVTKEQTDLISKRLEMVMHISGTNLAVWRSILQTLKPEVLIMQSLARKLDIEFSDEDLVTVRKMITSVENGDMEKLYELKAELYTTLLEKTQREQTSFSRQIIAI